MKNKLLLMPPDWPHISQSLSTLIPLASLHPAPLAWTSTPSARKPWLIALSGGPDSLALLLLLYAHFPKHRSKLRALHFNHHLRGKHSDADARFCKKLCRSLKIPLSIGHWKNPPKNPTETAARTARHAFFQQQQKLHRAPNLWLGHHQNDILETHLLRLARAATTTGLAAPRPLQHLRIGASTRTHLRPLLTLDKQSLQTHLAALGAPWCNDHTNHLLGHPRNRIRNLIIPQLAKTFPDRNLLAAAAQTRSILEDDDNALEQLLDQLAPLEKSPKTKLPILNLKTLSAARAPRALYRRALHRWLLALPPKHAPDLSRQSFEILLNAIIVGTSTRHSLSATTFAKIQKHQLHLQIQKSRS